MCLGEFASLIRTEVRLRIHAPPNEPDFTTHLTRVRLKQTKQRWCECTFNSKNSICAVLSVSSRWHWYIVTITLSNLNRGLQK